MKIIKYILIYSFMVTLSNLLFANSFKVISRQGEASVIVNEEHADIDVKKSFPDDYFSISTKEESYLVMDNGEKSIILMPSSKLTYESNNFTLHSGYMYIKSKHNDNIEMNAEAKEFMESDQVIERVISYFKAELEKLDDWNVDVINTAINNVKNALNVKGKLLYMPIRIKASGLMHGPDLADTIYLIGKDTVIKRLK